MYWEDFEIGRAYPAGGRVVTEEDLDRFIELTGLANRMFVSDEGAKAAGHGRRLVPAPFQLSLAMGLCQRAGLFDRVVAVAQFDELRFRRPLHPGETLSVEAVAAAKRPTSRAGRGLVILLYRGSNQRGEEVFTAKATYLFETRP